MFLINIERLITINSKFNFLKYVIRVLYQILKNYFKSYNVFISLQTLFFFIFDFKFRELHHINCFFDIVI